MFFQDIWHQTALTREKALTKAPGAQRTQGYLQPTGLEAAGFAMPGLWSLIFFGVHGIIIYTWIRWAEGAKHLLLTLGWYLLPHPDALCVSVVTLLPSCQSPLDTDCEEGSPGAKSHMHTTFSWSPGEIEANTRAHCRDCPYHLSRLA